MWPNRDQSRIWARYISNCDDFHYRGYQKMIPSQQDHNNWHNFISGKNVALYRASRPKTSIFDHWPGIMLSMMMVLFIIWQLTTLALTTKMVMRRLLWFYVPYVACIGFDVWVNVLEPRAPNIRNRVNIVQVESLFELHLNRIMIKKTHQ